MPPFAARAQQPDWLKRVAVLMGIAEDAEGQARVAAFRQRLADLKWQEGRDVRIDVRWGNGDASKISYYASELVRSAPDAVLATNTPTARALKQSTTSIPIVFAGSPIRSPTVWLSVLRSLAATSRDYQLQRSPGRQVAATPQGDRASDQARRRGQSKVRVLILEAGGVPSESLGRYALVTVYWIAAKGN